MKINGQLMPELIPAVEAHFNCKLKKIQTEGMIKEHSHPVSLMSCRNLYRRLDGDRTGVVST